jgi:hypothetical protein
MFWLFAFVLLAAVSSVLVGVPVAIARCCQLSSARRAVMVAIALSFTIAVATAVYMNATLQRLARQANEPIRGLIGRPVPNSGGDHVYTPRGRNYEKTAFIWPFCVGSLAAAFVGVATTVAARKHRAAVAWPVWSAVVASIGLMFVFWVCREFTAWDIFI